MTVEMATPVARWHPLVARCARHSSESLVGRGALLSGIFGIFLAVAVWSGADPQPRSAWQELAVASDAPALRRIDRRDVESLEQVFAEHGYRLASLREAPFSGVPRLAVTALPRDLAAVEDTEMRKALFLRTLLPLILQVNAELRRVGRLTRELEASRSASESGA